MNVSIACLMVTCLFSSSPGAAAYDNPGPCIVRFLWRPPKVKPRRSFRAFSAELGIFLVLGFAPMNNPALPPVILCQYASTAASESKSLGKLRDGMVAFIGCCEGSYELIHHRYICVIPPAEEVIPKWLRCHPLNLLPTSIRIQQWEIKVKTTRYRFFF
nr:hypothetical protein Iba_chr09aCG10590 [Ipomoea batatas]